MKVAAGGPPAVEGTHLAARSRVGIYCIVAGTKPDPPGETLRLYGRRDACRHTKRQSTGALSKTWRLDHAPELPMPRQLAWQL